MIRVWRFDEEVNAWVKLLDEPASSGPLGNGHTEQVWLVPSQPPRLMHLVYTGEDGRRRVKTL